MIQRVLLIILLCLVPATAKPKDLSHIQKLPERLTILRTECQKKWKSINTFVMIEGSEDFNRGLLTILEDLIRVYGNKKFINDTEVEAYAQVLISKLEFEKKLGNPLGEDRGTFSYQEVPAGLTVEIEEAVVILVRGIVDDDKSFNFDAWHKEWKKALEVDG